MKKFPNVSQQFSLCTVSLLCTTDHIHSINNSKQLIQEKHYKITSQQISLRISFNSYILDISNVTIIIISTFIILIVYNAYVIERLFETK